MGQCASKNFRRKNSLCANVEKDPALFLKSTDFSGATLTSRSSNPIMTTDRRRSRPGLPTGLNRRRSTRASIRHPRPSNDEQRRDHRHSDGASCGSEEEDKTRGGSGRGSLLVVRDELVVHDVIRKSGCDSFVVGFDDGFGGKALAPRPKLTSQASVRSSKQIGKARKPSIANKLSTQFSGISSKKSPCKQRQPTVPSPSKTKLKTHGWQGSKGRKGSGMKCEYFSRTFE